MLVARFTQAGLVKGSGRLARHQVGLPSTDTHVPFERVEPCLLRPTRGGPRLLKLNSSGVGGGDGSGGGDDDDG